MATTKKTNAALETIARRHLDLETLETRNADRLDFHEHAVWQIRDALEAAFRLGLEAAAKQKA